MHLLPSLCQKKRYLVFEVISKEKFSYPEIREEAEKALTSFLGQLGLSQASPHFLPEKFNQDKQRFLLKVSHKYVDEVKAALTLSKKIKNTPIIIRSIITSGTLKKASAYLG